jgi:hypothetical protein
MLKTSVEDEYVSKETPSTKRTSSATGDDAAWEALGRAGEACHELA